MTPRPRRPGVLTWRHRATAARRRQTTAGAGRGQAAAGLGLPCPHVRYGRAWARLAIHSAQEGAALPWGTRTPHQPVGDRAAEGDAQRVLCHAPARRRLACTTAAAVATTAMGAAPASAGVAARAAADAGRRPLSQRTRRPWPAAPSLACGHRRDRMARAPEISGVRTIRGSCRAAADRRAARSEDAPGACAAHGRGRAPLAQRVAPVLSWRVGKLMCSLTLWLWHLNKRRPGEGRRGGHWLLKSAWRSPNSAAPKRSKACFFPLSGKRPFVPSDASDRGGAFPRPAPASFGWG
jgi:hypothetical protein